MMNTDMRMPLNLLRDIGAELFAIHGECPARRNGSRIRGPHNEGVKTPHLLLEDADGVLKPCTAQGVAAHELGKAICLMCG